MYILHLLNYGLGRSFPKLDILEILTLLLKKMLHGLEKLTTAII